MNEKMKKRFIKMAVIFVVGAVVLYEPALVANAKGANVKVITKQFDVLLDIVTAIISSIGVIITLWGVSEWGMAFQGQDGMMQAHAFKRMAGGLIMILAPQILTILT